ncbi:Alanine dehydrogenase [compost metagenome]
MIIGVPREIKSYESRAGMTPSSVQVYCRHGHEVWIETGAGEGSGFGDREYIDAGARIVRDAATAWSAEMVVKVKEPQPGEYSYFREGLILFAYLHLAPSPELAQALIDRRVSAVAYETTQLDDGSLPLLIPMSEVAGRMSVQIGARLLEKPSGGKGIMLGGVPGARPAEVVIVGGGTVGTNAARVATGLGADVTLLDINPERLRRLDDQFGGRLKTLICNPYVLAQAVQKADLLVGAVLVPGARSPKVVAAETVKQMRPGSVIVDVAIDQGGSVETVDRITTHGNPTFERHGILHYSVANIPGAVPRTSTTALSNATTPYGLLMANHGLRQAVLSNPALAKGLCVINGQVTCGAVAESLGIPEVPLLGAL